MRVTVYHSQLMKSSSSLDLITLEEESASSLAPSSPVRYALVNPNLARVIGRVGKVSPIRYVDDSDEEDLTPSASLGEDSSEFGPNVREIPFSQQELIDLKRRLETQNRLSPADRHTLEILREVLEEDVTR